MTIKDKLNLFRQLNDERFAEVDLRLLMERVPNHTSIARFGRAPKRYANEIQYLLLDVASKEEILENRGVDSSSKTSIGPSSKTSSTTKKKPSSKASSTTKKKGSSKASGTTKKKGSSKTSTKEKEGSTKNGSSKTSTNVAPAKTDTKDSEDSKKK